ncbi:MAG: four helix bundle protein [Deltaproteobacteria bacterium]|nr:four helix bundle protein [Deltaproteobacteria bacterium]
MGVTALNRIERFQDLEVWRTAHTLVLGIYRLTKNFPREELYGLTSQIRRAAVSVAANIAEGFKKRGSKEKIRFYNTSQGSLAEVEYYLLVVRDLQYAKETYELDRLVEQTGKMLNGLIASIEAKY